jgi:hypothetical protein
MFGSRLLHYAGDADRLEQHLLREIGQRFGDRVLRTWPSRFTAAELYVNDPAGSA